MRWCGARSLTHAMQLVNWAYQNCRVVIANNTTTNHPYPSFLLNTFFYCCDDQQILHTKPIKNNRRTGYLWSGFLHKLFLWIFVVYGALLCTMSCVLDKLWNKGRYTDHHHHRQKQKHYYHIISHHITFYLTTCLHASSSFLTQLHIFTPHRLRFHHKTQPHNNKKCIMCAHIARNE